MKHSQTAIAGLSSGICFTLIVISAFDGNILSFFGWTVALAWSLVGLYGEE